METKTSLRRMALAKRTSKYNCHFDTASKTIIGLQSFFNPNLGGLFRGSF